jgi:hypothetical protein
VSGGGGEGEGEGLVVALDTQPYASALSTGNTVVGLRLGTPTRLRNLPPEKLPPDKIKGNMCL